MSLVIYGHLLEFKVTLQSSFYCVMMQVTMTPKTKSKAKFGNHSQREVPLSSEGFIFQKALQTLLLSWQLDLFTSTTMEVS